MGCKLLTVRFDIASAFLASAKLLGEVDTAFWYAKKDLIHKGIKWLFIMTVFQIQGVSKKRNLFELIYLKDVLGQINCPFSILLTIAIQFY